MPGFRVRNHSKFDAAVDVFITKWTISNGSDAWCRVDSSLGNASKSDNWERHGWEMLVFRDPETKRRRGWYLDCEAKFLQVTFYGFEQDLGLLKQDS